MKICIKYIIQRYNKDKAKEVKLGKDKTQQDKTNDDS